MIFNGHVFLEMLRFINHQIYNEHKNFIRLYDTCKTLNQMTIKLSNFSIDSIILLMSTVFTVKNDRHLSNNHTEIC